MSVKKLTGLAATAILLTSLAACKADVDQRAKDAGCGGIRKNLHEMFLLAGWWQQGQAYITAHEKKYGSSALIRITTEQEHGGYNRNNEKNYEIVEKFFDLNAKSPGNEGAALVKAASQVEKLSYQGEKIAKCASFIEEMLEDKDFGVHLQLVYANPKRYDNYSKTQYRP